MEVNVLDKIYVFYNIFCIAFQCIQFEPSGAYNFVFTDFGGIFLVGVFGIIQYNYIFVLNASKKQINILRSNTLFSKLLKRSSLLIKKLT